LVIGEIVGVKSMLDNDFYRAKVLQQVNETTYLIQYIDFGEKHDVSISNIFEISAEFKVSYYNYCA